VTGPGPGEGGVSEVEFRVLGAVEAVRDGARLPLGGARPRASIVYNLGLLALAQKDPRATEYLQRSLTIRRALNDQAGVAECLEGLAVVAEGDRDLVTAARRGLRR